MISSLLVIENSAESGLHDGTGCARIRILLRNFRQVKPKQAAGMQLPSFGRRSACGYLRRELAAQSRHPARSLNAAFAARIADKTPLNRAASPSRPFLFCAARARSTKTAARAQFSTLQSGRDSGHWLMAQRSFWREFTGRGQSALSPSMDQRRLSVAGQRP